MDIIHHKLFQICLTFSIFCFFNVPKKNKNTKMSYNLGYIGFATNIIKNC